MITVNNIWYDTVSQISIQTITKNKTNDHKYRTVLKATPRQRVSGAYTVLDLTIISFELIEKNSDKEY